VLRGIAVDGGRQRGGDIRGGRQSGRAGKRRLAVNQNVIAGDTLDDTYAR
jgi:hypothetical protein